MIRLLIAFLFLALSSFLSASTIHYYYEKNGGGVCTTSVSALCATLTTLQSPSCSLSGTSVLATWTITNISGDGKTTTTSTASGYAGIQRAHVCPTGQKFLLTGCTPSCVPDPCAPLAGQVFAQTVSCGTASCPNGGKIVEFGSDLGCDKGAAIWQPKPLQSASKGECSGTLKPIQEITSGSVDPRASIGASSAVMYCGAEYTYTGSSGQEIPNPSNLASLTYSDAIPTTENGTCPPNTVKGQVGAPDPVTGEAPWYCIPDDKTQNQCPTGQIKDNSGNCVPTNEAGTCPTGQVKDASGNCVTPPPPKDTDGDGTPDDQDDTPNGDTGGGSGDSGGNGSGGSGGSGDSGGNGGGGSGEKASASTADGCGTPPSCSGDPLQCASFIQDWKQNCQMMSVTQGDADKANALSAASKAEFTTSQTQQNQKVTGFFGDFKNTANVSLNSGQCPNDLNLSVMGKQMTLKFSESCFFWRLLRALVIASAYLAAASIVFRSLA